MASVKVGEMKGRGEKREVFWANEDLEFGTEVEGLVMIDGRSAFGRGRGGRRAEI
jgi:hypothetical protein